MSVVCRIRNIAATATALLLMLAAQISAASAQLINCTATITSPITFSGLNVINGPAVDTTATFEVSCSGLLSIVTVSVCPSIEDGSAGASGGIRRMQRISGTETLNFNLYQDASRTVPWGSVNDPTLGNPPLIVLLVPVLSTGSATRTIYARVFSGQTGITPGTYQSSFTGAETNIRYGVLSGLVDCTGSLSGLGQTTTAPFTVQATVDDDCALNVTQNVDFGTAGFLDAAVDGVAEIEITCTNTTPYTVGLTRQAGSLPLGSWEMINGPETVTYGLYTDVNRTDLWGAPPSDHVSGTGNGATQTLDVYGRVPAQTTPPVGTYADTVIVTVTY